MATLLDKDLIRETTIKIDGREIILTLGEDQSISMKLKGMKSGTVSISINDLYNQLVGSEDVDVEPIKAAPIKNGGAVISLYAIRDRCNVVGFDYPTTVKLDNLLNDLIEENKK